jgi:aminopeptidase N
MRKVIICAAALLLFSSISFSQDKTVTYYQDGASNPPDLVISLKYLRAEVSFEPAGNLVYGNAEFTFTTNRYKTDSIVFYTPDFTITNVTIEGKAVKWQLRDKNLVLYPGSMLDGYHRESSLSIVYEAHPLAGLIYFTGWKPEEAGKRKEIWAHRPHGWLPYMDARITADIYIRFDSSFRVFSNGERMDIRNNPDGTRTWHYRMKKDHPFFSTVLVIGDYDFKTSKSAGGVPMEFWYYRGQEERVQPTYQYSEAMMDFFEKELGVKYPYPLYRQVPVIDYMYGAMETTTSTVFGDFMLIDPHAFWQRNYINTNAHEMAHQWFGNCISHLVNKDVWLTESFATYYAKIFEKATFGENHFQNLKNDEITLVLNAAKTNNYPVGSSMGGVARIYQKGSLVLEMLRYVMGDEEFRNAVKYYTLHSEFTNAETGDFIRAVYESSCKPYNWFFEEWVLHGGEPVYKVSRAVTDDSTGKRSTLFSVWQVQETTDLIGLFKMPVVFEVHYKDGTTDRQKAWIENKYHEVVIPNPDKKEIDFTLFDPGREILKRVTFDKPFEELSAQALRAPGMIDRYDALVALRTVPEEMKRDLLLACYSRETFHLTKSEIIAQLSSGRNEQVLALLQKALNDPDAKVRYAVLKNVVPLPSELKTDAEKALNDFSYLNIETALDNLAASFPDDAGRYLELTKNMEGWRGKNIRMKWLEIALNNGKTGYYDELLKYTRPEYEFETRMNSLSLAKRLNWGNEEIMKNAMTAYLHWNPKLSGTGKDVLTYFYQQDAFHKMIDSVIRNGDWNEKDKARLTGFLGTLN